MTLELFGVFGVFTILIELVILHYLGVGRTID